MTYDHLITKFVHSEFPKKLCGDSPILLDLLTDEVLGTKQVRYGPKPSVESIVSIREVLAHYIAQKAPIPFMVPWGSEKPDGSRIDVAELSAVKMMKTLFERVSSHYQPGAQFNVRLEDVSAPHLFVGQEAQARANALMYVSDFTQLLTVLELPYIKPVPESSLVSEPEFNKTADDVLIAMSPALKAWHSGDKARMATLLDGVGWKGGFKDETVSFYLTQYAKLYPSNNLQQNLQILARYFAGALARYKLKVRGDDPAWGGKFIDLAFVPPTPGTEGQFARRVHYRTMPGAFTSLHIAPWRAKGYLKITNDNEVTPKLTTFFDRSLEFHQHTVKINGGLNNPLTSVLVQADYILT